MLLSSARGAINMMISGTSIWATLVPGNWRTDLVSVQRLRSGGKSAGWQVGEKLSSLMMDSKRYGTGLCCYNSAHVTYTKKTIENRRI